tara:strand:+ start:918 stop:1892 length:975 start_codon:yes stop_codon:yes gene_type:complete
MAFLNNSGDIILDAVLTDLGRKRLSQGDGSFKISQFALGDDEIDYGQYNLSTGSAYQDLDILQTPILEAITDNVASIKSKLVTYSRTDLLYLPVVELNQAGTQPNFATSSIGTYIAVVNSLNDFQNVAGTVYGLDKVGSNSTAVPLPGNIFARGGDRSKSSMVLVQGIDSTQVAFTNLLDPTLTEDTYFAYFDDRLGKLTALDGTPLKESYVDDDNIATYVFTQANNPTNFVAIDAPNEKGSNPTSNNAIAGPYNRQALRFSIYASDNVAYSDFLFEQFGNTADTTDASYAAYTVYNIDTEVRVVGAKTGYSISIPVRFVKIKF